FIEGDGTGVDIWPAAQLVMDAAAAKFGKRIAWKEVLAGQKAFDATGEWLPQETVDTFSEYLIGIKGPLTTPIGGGIRSLNVALRQLLDLYVCLHPVRWFTGVPSPVKHPEKVDMVIFRENTEAIYACLAAQVGGIGIAPGGNINYVTGHGIFEATHGTAPKYAGQDKVNPGSVLLSGVMMFEHLGWEDAADAIVRALEATIAEKIVTYDFARLMDGATEVKTSQFAQAIVERL